MTAQIPIPTGPSDTPTTLTPPPQPTAAINPGQGQRAAQQAATDNSVRVSVPILGTIDLPPTEDLTYLAGVGVLAVAGILEWPIAATLAIGHLLANSRRNKTLRDFGHALEEA